MRGNSAGEDTFEEKDKQAIDRDIVSCSRDYVGSDDGCFLSYF